MLKVWLPLTTSGDLVNRGTMSFTATNYNATYSTSSKLGGCYLFDANGEYIDLGVTTNAILPTAGSSFSVAFWLYPTQDWVYSSGNTGSAIIGAGNYLVGGWSINVTVDDSPDTIRMHLLTASVETELVCLSCLTLNTWAHFAFVYDKNAATMKAYKNGLLIATKTSAGTWSAYSTTSVRLMKATLGGYTATTMFGSLCDVRIYDEVLSLKSIKELAKALVIHYTFNNLNIKDCSGFKHNGTLTGTAALSTSTPRYSNCILLSNAAKLTNYITSISPSFVTTGSISFWAKIRTKGSSGWLPFVGLSTSYYIMAWNNSGNFYHSNAGSSLTIYVDGTAATASPSTYTSWHHYCITGVNLSSWTTFKFNNFSTSWDSDMDFSDFRMYNTVLTATDAYELAHSPTFIDRCCNLITSEFVELSSLSKIQFHKTGVVNTTNANTLLPRITTVLITQTNMTVNGVEEI